MTNTKTESKNRLNQQDELKKKVLLQFPFGILGFADLRSFYLLDAEEPPFYWLQAEARDDLAFILLEPKFVDPDYKLDVNIEELKTIGLNNYHDPDILCLVIVRLNQDFNKISANLQGPIVINRQKKLGCQCISENPRWQIRHFFLTDNRQSGSRAC